MIRNLSKDEITDTKTHNAEKLSRFREKLSRFRDEKNFYEVTLHTPLTKNYNEMTELYSLIDAYEPGQDTARILEALHAHVQFYIDQHLTDEDLLAVPPKERLLELLILRLESLDPIKDFFKKFTKDVFYKFSASKILFYQYYRAEMEYVLRKAHLPIQGPLGVFKVQALIALSVASTYTWLCDDSLEPTIVCLDRGLTWCDQQMERYK